MKTLLLFILLAPRLFAPVVVSKEVAFADNDAIGALSDANAAAACAKLQSTWGL